MPSELIQLVDQRSGAAFNIHHQTGGWPLGQGAKRILQRGIVATAAQGKLAVEKTGAQKMILRHQNDKRSVCFAGLADGLTQKFEPVEEGGAKGERVNPSASLPVRRRR